MLIIESRNAPIPCPQTAAIVVHSLRALARRLRRERADHGISPSKLAVLGRLLQDGPRTATDLAAQERIQPQSLTRMIAALAERGLIHRRALEADRRQIEIAITPAGQALLLEDQRRQEAWLGSVIVATMTPDERATLRAAAPLLARLAERIA